MAWEWVAPVVTGVVGVVGTTSTLTVAWIARRQAVDVARVTTAAQLAIARDEWRVAAMEEAVDIGGRVMTELVVANASESEALEIETLNANRRRAAAIRIHGDDATRKKHPEWLASVNRLAEMIILKDGTEESWADEIRVCAKTYAEFTESARRLATTPPDNLDGP